MVEVERNHRSFITVFTSLAQALSVTMTGPIWKNKIMLLWKEEREREGWPVRTLFKNKREKGGGGVAERERERGAWRLLVFQCMQFYFSLNFSGLCKSKYPLGIEILKLC